MPVSDDDRRDHVHEHPADEHRHERGSQAAGPRLRLREALEHHVERRGEDPGRRTEPEPLRDVDLREDRTEDPTDTTDTTAPDTTATDSSLPPIWLPVPDDTVVPMLRKLDNVDYATFI